MRITVIASFIFLLVCASAFSIDERLGDARKCFDQYAALEAAFDPAVADLCADDAKIQNTRTYPDGRKKVLTMPAPAYKALIRQAMPLAKQRGDSSTYTDITLSQDGDKVRVTATRFSNLKKYSSPLSLLVAPNKEGVWLIHEELSESQP
jgi:hypothetical protein